MGESRKLLNSQKSRLVPETQAYRYVKKGDRVKAVLSVGGSHPLAGKEVEVEIVASGTGYDGRRILAKTVKPVHYPEEQQGIAIMRGDEIVRWEPRAAYDEVFEGWVEQVRLGPRKNPEGGQEKKALSKRANRRNNRR